MVPVRSSLRVRGFPPLLSSYSVNELGDNLGLVALAILVLDQTDSALATMGLFLMARFLPAFAAPALTAMLDQVPVGRALPALYAVEAAAFGALALLTDSFSLPLVLALAFVDGLLALTGRALSRGAIAAVLSGPGLLREGNALINVAFAVTSAAGPALAGLIVHVWGAETALWADAASFVVVALVIALNRSALPAADSGPREGWRARVQDGLDYVRSHPTAGRLIAGQGVAILFFALIIPIEVVYVKDTLGSSDLGFGVLLGSWGLGIVVGSGLFARTRGRALSSLVLASTAVIGLGYGVMAVAPTLLVACLGSVLGGIGNGVQWVGVMTALQESVGERYQARAAGLLESVAAAVPGVGFLVGGLLTSLASPRVAYAVSAVGVAVVVLVWARRPIVVDRAPAEAPA